jgi:hypothetical protein
MSSSNVKLTLIGGPAVLIEYEGMRILTDPTFDPPGHYQSPHGPVKHVKTEGPAVSVEHTRGGAIEPRSSLRQPRQLRSGTLQTGGRDLHNDLGSGMPRWKRLASPRSRPACSKV